MSQEVSKRYAKRGVSASKEDVHNTIKNIDKGLVLNGMGKGSEVFVEI